MAIIKYIRTMETTRTFEIRSKQEASDIITTIHNHFFCNDNDEMVIEEVEDDSGNITVYAWDDSMHYNERNYPQVMMFRRNK